MNTILGLLGPHILEIVAVVVTALVTFLTARISTWTGVQIESKHRDALHSALMSGAKLALERAGIDTTPRRLSDTAGAAVNEAVGDVRARVASEVDVVVAHVRNSVPDAVKNLKATETTLRNLAQSKLADLRMLTSNF